MNAHQKNPWLEAMGEEDCAAVPIGVIASGIVAKLLEIRENRAIAREGMAIALPREDSAVRKALPRLRLIAAPSTVREMKRANFIGRRE